MAKLGHRAYDRGCAELRTYLPCHEIGTVSSEQIVQRSYLSRRTLIATAVHGEGAASAQTLAHILQRVYYGSILRKV